MQEPEKILTDYVRDALKLEYDGRVITCKNGHTFVALPDHPGIGVEFYCVHCLKEQVYFKQLDINSLISRREIQTVNPKLDVENSWVPCYMAPPPLNTRLLVSFELQGRTFVAVAEFDVAKNSWALEPSAMASSFKPDIIYIAPQYGTHWRLLPNPAATLKWWEWDKNL